MANTVPDERQEQADMRGVPQSQACTCGSAPSTSYPTPSPIRHPTHTRHSHTHRPSAAAAPRTPRRCWAAAAPVQPCEAAAAAAAQAPHLHTLTKRGLLQALAITLTLQQLPSPTGGSAAAAQQQQQQQQPTNTGAEECERRFRPYLSAAPDWSGPGPLEVVHLPVKLEHTCASCFPACIGTSCLIRVGITYPKGGSALGLGPPYPLAIFSSGFLVSSDSYQSYADTLAAWGYTVLLYDRQETVADFLDDVACVAVVQDLITWCCNDPLLRRIADTRRCFLVGHSRGGKISALAAAVDPRVAAVCLIDAVDNTQYAPLAPGFPSAVAALRNAPGASSGTGTGGARLLPVAVVGSGQGGACAPLESNYSRFYEANRGPTWEVCLLDAGHFSFLDARSALQRAVCPEGEASEEAVRRVSQAVMVAWAETMVRHRGVDVAARGLPAYPWACTQQQLRRGEEAELPQQLQRGRRVERGWGGVKDGGAGAGGGAGGGAPPLSAAAAAAGFGPRLPTWGSPLPQFYEDTLGPKQALPQWQQREGGKAIDSSDLGRQQQAAALRQRLGAGEAPLQSGAGHGQGEEDTLLVPRPHSGGGGGVDSSLQDGLTQMLDKVSSSMWAVQVGARYKNF